jgi:hypothetical protein
MLEQRRDPAITITAILASQGDDGLGECVFVFALCRPIALRTAWLLHQAARMTLADPMLGTSTDHHTTASFRA